MNNRLILVGCGAFARELINWVDDLVDLGRCNKISGFLDDYPKAMENYSYNLPYLGTIQDYMPQVGDRLLMALGDPNAKKKIYEELKVKGAMFETFVHPSAVIARTAKLGEGVVVCPQAFICADAVIGNLCAINGSSSVGHDVHLGHFCTLSAHVDITGGVKVGDCVFFGSGARVLPKVKIGSGARIGAGSVVVRGVSVNSVVYAPPAKRL